MSVYISDRADATILRIRADRAALGLSNARFDEALARARAQLSLFPESGHAVASGLREKPLVGVPYTLVYRLLGDDVFILSIANRRRGE